MSSKFKGILDQAKDRKPEPVEETPPPPSPAPIATPSKKRGRPSGKRSDTDYIQVTAYIQKDRHRDVKIALLKSGGDKDFSELVDDLLGQWLVSLS